MKMTPNLAYAAKKMQPGEISRDGFFGRDARDLPTLLGDHARDCARLGVHPQDIGSEMARIGSLGMKGLGAPVNVEDRWEVTADENRGKIPCPFPHPGVFQKTVYKVKNLITGKTVRYSELSIHLIAEHGFFQGNGAPFHNNPQDLVEVLEVKPSQEEKEIPGI